MEGDGRSLGVRALDRLKNQYTQPSATEIDLAITLKAILAPGNDIGRWKVKEGVEITGYLWDAKRCGSEGTNCHARDDLDRDTHIELVLDVMNEVRSRRVIVEVTTQWRYIMGEPGTDWSTRGLRDRFLVVGSNCVAGCCLTPSTSGSQKTQRQGAQKTGGQPRGRFIQ